MNPQHGHKGQPQGLEGAGNEVPVLEEAQQGQVKKLLIANNVGMLWDSYKAMVPSDLTVAGAWLGVLAFTFQIYFDFSGYSDTKAKMAQLIMTRNIV